jgi:hypothetical protein
MCITACRFRRTRFRNAAPAVHARSVVEKNPMTEASFSVPSDTTSKPMCQAGSQLHQLHRYTAIPTECQLRAVHWSPIGCTAPATWHTYTTPSPAIGGWGIENRNRIGIAIWIAIEMRYRSRLRYRFRFQIQFKWWAVLTLQRWRSGLIFPHVNCSAVYVNHSAVAVQRDLWYLTAVGAVLNSGAGVNKVHVN